MNKTAFLEHMSPAEVLLSAGGVGAGGYGALRLIQELMQQNSKQEYYDKPEGLTIPIPEAKVAPPIKQASVDEPLLRALALMTGIPLGVYGADKAYGAYKNNQLNNEIEDEQQKRLALMGQFKQGEEKTTTPRVDAFCAGLQEKLAEYDDGILTRMGSGIEDSVNALSGDSENADAAHKAIASAGVGTAGEMIPFSKQLMIALALTGLGTGGYTLGSMIKARNDKENAEQKRKYPDVVSLQPTPIE